MLYDRIRFLKVWFGRLHFSLLLITCDENNSETATHATVQPAGKKAGCEGGGSGFSVSAVCGL